MEWKLSRVVKYQGTVWRENINDSSTLYTLLGIQSLTANCHDYKSSSKILSLCDNVTETVEKRTKFRIETNQSTNGKVSWEVHNTSHFVGFSILLRTVIGFFEEKIAILCSQITFWLVNSFSGGLVWVVALWLVCTLGAKQPLLCDHK